VKIVDLTFDSAKHWICHICFSITKALLYGLLKCGIFLPLVKKFYFYLYILLHKFFYEVKVEHIRQTTQHTSSYYVD